MIGKILAVKVKVGQAVKRGEPVVVLEAMKMENDIVAPSGWRDSNHRLQGGRSGRVRSSTCYP